MRFMRRAATRLGLATAAVILMAAPTAAGPQSSDAEIRQALIQQSIASYDGACPCPYSTTRNGSRCGGRSAYSRPGGTAPLCYARDVSADQVAAYRRRR